VAVKEGIPPAIGGNIKLLKNNYITYPVPEEVLLYTAE
jgi:hypothetical protein